jgi:hypothetical protein
MARHDSTLPLGDKIAITVACLGGAMAAIIYLIPTKTPLSTGIMLGLLLLFSCYPIIHFVKIWKIKLPAVLILCVLVPLFGKKEWPRPDPEPTADIRTGDEVFVVPVVGKPPALNFWVYNDAPHNLVAKNYSSIEVDRVGIRSSDDEAEREDKGWARLRDYVAVTRPYDSLIYAAKNRSWVSVVVDSNPLTMEEVKDLEDNSGGTTIRFLTVFLYTDAGGEHELDHCSFVQNTKVVGNCRRHNGPAWPMPHQPF